MTYCYACECGKRDVQVRPVSEATMRPKCPECGNKMERDFSAERPGGHLPQCWPMWSDNGGCHSEQIGEWSGTLEKHGVSADFRKDGAIKWESAAHRKKCCEALGMFDRNGGYGDPQKKR
jgi:hypothetical protein